MNPRLGNATLSSVRGAALPAYDRSRTSIGLVHIGPGAFFRAHQASYIDSLLQLDPAWAISAIALKSSGVRDALGPQDGLYVLNELSVASNLRVIGAIRELLVASEEYPRVFARLAAQETRVVTMTVTEKGYCLNGAGILDESHPDIVHDLQSPQTPRSVVGLLTEALRLRRAAGVAPFVVISCDNLANNGHALRNAVLVFAHRIDAGLAAWIEREVAFPRTMVDSITPATDDALRQRVATATGVDDAWPIQREAFVQWVIEELPGMNLAGWRRVGVTLAKDVSLFERAKLRLLNGAHSTLAYVGSLRGLETVGDAMKDQPLVSFVGAMMREDIAATLDKDAGLDVNGYIDAVLDRFRNPGIRHLLSQIAWDGSKKLPVRLLGTIADTLAAGRSAQRLAVPIAAWMRFIVRQSNNNVPIVDPDAAQLSDLGRACNDDPAHDIGLFLALDKVFARSVAGNPDFRHAVESAYRKLLTPQTAV